jgi:predicted O-methyltransferase YrrM
MSIVKNLKIYSKPILINIKTVIKSFMPIGDLVKEPYNDKVYCDLWRTSLPFMHQYVPKNLTQHEIEWIDNLALKLSVSIKNSEPNWIHGYFLYDLIKTYAQSTKKKEISFFESGTAKGFSAIIAAKAITNSRKIPNIVTIDILGNEKRYWNAFGDFNGKRTRMDLLSEHKDLVSSINFVKMRSRKLNKKNFDNTKIDLAFLDGPHTYADVKHEFRYVINRLEKNGIVFFDDYNHSRYPGIVKFVGEIDSNNISYITNDNRSYAIYYNK